MKIKFVMSCCVLMMAFPLNAFALQGENIAFERMEPETYDGPPNLIRALVDLSTDGVVEDVGDSSATLATAGRVGTSSATFLGSTKIISPINVPVFIPSHCVAIGQQATLIGGPEDTVRARLRAGAVVNATYATSPGLASPSSDTNEFATMEVFFHFLGVGSCSNFSFTPNNGFFPEGGQLPLGFSQRIEVGDTVVSVFHVGNGMFSTFGMHAASTEKSLDNYTTETLITSTCGVNHLWVARQRVPKDSGVVDVHISAQLDTLGPLDQYGNPGDNPWWVTSTASAYFFARDYCADDISVRFDEAGNPVDANGDPIPDAGGTPTGPDEGGGSLFCNPIKVLINNTLDLGEGEEEPTLTESSPGVNLGIAELDGTVLAAFRDLDTVAVRVARDSGFLCSLTINNAETGQNVAFFEPGDAIFDRATGMWVFDLSSVGPFAPGVYEVLVGGLYQADVYVAIPGDVNLDGVVDDLSLIHISEPTRPY